jgi:beta-galactosidase
MHMAMVAQLLAIFAAAALIMNAADRRTQRFVDSWKFQKGSVDNGASPALDDSKWQVVRLPHDWSADAPVELEGDGSTGKLPWRGEGWYRKHFALPNMPAGTRLFFDFDGVMANPQVYVNGRLVGSWDYGYMSFQADATPAAKFGADNVIAVHADTRQHGSRWYPGGGIYREVRMVMTSPTHIRQWGVQVTTPETTKAQVRTTVANANPSTVVVTRILDPNGKEVARSSGPAVTTLTIPNPMLWDVNSPNLYTAAVELLQGKEQVDSYRQTFGIRTIRWDKDQGLFLNGRRVELKGVNLHHDQGPLGGAALTRSIQRQLEIMRDMGVNAIRTSHNPPAPQLLDLCDRMGFLVWDESFDKWDNKADIPPGADFKEYMRRQVGAFVRRDFNHPSIFIWSIGNEMGMPPLDRIRYVVDLFHEFDPTRLTTEAYDQPRHMAPERSGIVDIPSWNYGLKYVKGRERLPDRPTMYSESASTVSTRGYYALPLPKDPHDFSAGHLQVSSYDFNAPPWAEVPDMDLAGDEEYKFNAGEFVWTGIDYIGEPTPYSSQGRMPDGSPVGRRRASRFSYFGAVDLGGIPKDRFYLYRSVWAPEKTTIHILPHWNWQGSEGKPIPVFVYTNGDSSELFLNGRSLGKRTKDPKAPITATGFETMARYRLRWDVPYEAGELKAVAYDHARRLGEAVMRTAGPARRVRLTPDRAGIAADGDDLSFVLVEVLDERGQVVPDSSAKIRFTVAGPALIAGITNGDPQSTESFVDNPAPVFHGKSMLVLRSLEGRRGSVKLTAVSDGLQSASATVTAK